MAACEAPGAKPLFGPAKGPTIEAVNVKLSNFQFRQPSVSQPAAATRPSGCRSGRGDTSTK